MKKCTKAALVGMGWSVIITTLLALVFLVGAIIGGIAWAVTGVKGVGEFFTFAGGLLALGALAGASMCVEDRMHAHVFPRIKAWVNR